MFGWTSNFDATFELVVRVRAERWAAVVSRVGYGCDRKQEGCFGKTLSVVGVNLLRAHRRWEKSGDLPDRTGAWWREDPVPWQGPGPPEL